MSDALLDAIQTRDVDRVASLLAAGADPNERGKSRYGRGAGLPPLEAAIDELQAFKAIGPYGPKAAGPIDSVVLLLRHGARVTGWDTDEGPLWDAVMMKHIEAVRLLLAAGADPNLKDNEGTSPLRFCTENGLLEMARLLLQCGAGKTMDSRGLGKTIDESGRGINALGWAVMRFDVEMVRLLLAHGANPQVRDDDGYIPIERFRFEILPEDAAGQERFREICRLLGADPSTVRIKRPAAPGSPASEDPS